MFDRMWVCIAASPPMSHRWRKGNTLFTDKLFGRTSLTCCLALVSLHVRAPACVPQRVVADGIWAVQQACAPLWCWRRRGGASCGGGVPSNIMLHLASLLVYTWGAGVSQTPQCPRQPAPTVVARWAGIVAATPSGNIQGSCLSCMRICYCAPLYTLIFWEFPPGRLGV